MKKLIWLAMFALGWLLFLAVYSQMLVATAFFGGGRAVALLVVFGTYPVALLNFFTQLYCEGAYGATQAPQYRWFFKAWGAVVALAGASLLISVFVSLRVQPPSLAASAANYLGVASSFASIVCVLSAGVFSLGAIGRGQRQG